VADNELLLPFGLTVGAIAGALIFCVPAHVALTDETAMPIKAAVAALDAKCFPMIGDRSFKLGAAVTAKVPQFFGFQDRLRAWVSNCGQIRS
jgi:hypothetical protein